ncbi:cyclodeaminase/cyclohydrolase family protein [Porphyromonas endodontalis]|jgi:putative formiminotransferase-cyclodeaminase/formiminotetrahydrofolate cyclodeaminase|uniref:Formiminotransferase-cyclodeaminase n=1 Tax=Porphyromonas endodontalis (strain ATCC 35406 / DSM 24491 / JCM 8526 / CCUG 16442 / BCRC 14492 / NCTC 13058 / HG 370) TaxID=553175 RepID=C3J924_POREA|nr:cyclodeaminase/cyclohydrolase family protein [Porphyromonas endodontalis]EEN83317.1 Formiminotransferase-cyclodeaminase [Porphyromonas endodontalis ATCC 35406]UBH64945.1 cyclodeaminase/cyclohydrolase family protein [Porphyromonas endodontalis]SUB68460.1 Methenyltetrahydrofolate cyclohydrolase [Porphyromonas endodontalis]
MLTELTVKGLLAETAGDAPVPGGGSISALNGAIAAALAEMVANLTIGKKKYADVQDEMAEIAKSAAALQKELVLDVDRDSEAYDGVSQAFKLPKETDEEKAIRSAAIQENTKKAALVPMEVARRASALLPSIEAVVARGNQNAVTDGCVAMMCARVAVVGALFNVRINLTSIKDEEFVARLREEADRLEADVLAREAAVIAHTKKACE